MSLPADTAARLAARDAVSASDTPNPVAASRPVGGSVGTTTKPNLAGSIQALKELAAKSNAAAPIGIADEPLAVAYEKRIHTLQDSLKERDHVVQMLTQRLEQAADQLDRLQRTGGGRGGAVAAGIPPEMLESQQSMSEQMTKLLGQWEELQAANLLTRIESRINDLHDLVSSGEFSPTNVSAIAAMPSAKEKEAASAPPKASTGASVFSDIPAAEPAKTGWEAIKAAMLAGENLGTSPASSPAPAAPREAPSKERTAPEPVAAERPIPPPLPEPPAAVDFDIADQQTLAEAIRARDEYISLLLRRLSSPDGNTEFPDWEKLNFVPEELHRELLALRDRLQEKLRVAEVDLSLQRAKLAREEARLTIKADQLTRQMKQLGLATDESSPSVNGNGNGSRALNEGSNATQGRRWLQFLQRSAGNGSGTDGK